MKKLIILLFVVLMIANVSGVVFAQEVELDVWVVRDNYQIDLTEWNNQNPDIKINYEVVSWERALNKLIMAASSNRAPDIAVLDRPWVGILGGLGHLEPMEDYLDKYWTEENKSDYIESTWQFAKYNDTLYAIPFTVFGRALYYRADWFEEAGIEAPETWEDVVEAGKHFTDPENGIWGLSVRGKRDDGTTQGWLPIFYAMGGEFENDIPVIDSEAGVNALELYRKFVWDDEIMSPETVVYGSGEARGAFLSGEAAMSIIGTHIAPSVVKNGIPYGDFKMTHIPLGEGVEGPKNVATGFQWAVHAQSENKDAAARFVKYATSKEAQVEFNSDYMEATRQSVYEVEEYKEAKPWMSFIKEDMEGFRPLPALPEYSEISLAIQRGLQEMLGNENADAEQVAKDIQAEINSIIN